MEDKVMMNIIHENYLRTRAANEKKVIEKEEITFVDKFIMSVSALVFCVGLVAIISVIECLKF